MVGLHNAMRLGRGRPEEDAPSLDSGADRDKPTLASSLRAAVMPRASADTGSSPALGCGWRLVWCYERCYKSEHEEKLRLLDRAATAAGGALLCFRKANKFVSWCGKAEPLPYILLTDWREAKPCLALLDGAKVACRPALTVVLCEEAEPKFYLRAAAWAEKRGPGADPVHVCGDARRLLRGLGGLSSEQRCGGLGPSCHTGATACSKQLQRQAKVASEANATQPADGAGGHTSNTPSAAPASTRPEQAPAAAAGKPPLTPFQPAQLQWAHAVGMRAAMVVQVPAAVGAVLPLYGAGHLLDAAALAQAQPKMVGEAALVKAWVFQALSHYGMTSRFEVEQLLFDAMPEVYEE